MFPARLICFARFRASIERSALSPEEGFWHRLAHQVMRRPIVFAVVSAAIMIALGVPFLGVKFTGVDATVLPKSASARQVDDVLRSDFPLARLAAVRMD